MEPLDDFVLGETATPLSIGTSEENRAAALAMVSQGRRTVLIFSRDLDPRVYNTAEFADALSTLARLSKYSWIRMLVQDSSGIVRDGHRLVELARRLSSRVELRKAHPDFRDANRAFLVVDEIGLILRVPADRYDAVVSFHDGMAARGQTRFFHRVWDRSAPDPELRRL